MLSYKDKTFCPFSDECFDGEACHRALTKEVFEGSDKTGLPICQYVAPPKECFKRKTT